MKQRPEADSPLLRFRLGTEWYGLEVGSVWQIAPLRRVHPVPGAPGCVRGLVEIEGRLLTVIDPARLYGLDRGEAPETEVAILLNPPHQNLALAVAGLPEVYPAPRGGEPTPERPTGRCRSIGTEASIREIQVGQLVADCDRVIAEATRTSGGSLIPGGGP